MIFATCIKCGNQDFERPDKGAYLVSRKVEVVKMPSFEKKRKEKLNYKVIFRKTIIFFLKEGRSDL